MGSPRAKVPADLFRWIHVKTVGFLCRATVTGRGSILLGCLGAALAGPLGSDRAMASGWMALDPRESLGTPERVQLLSVLQKAARCLDAPDSEGSTPLHALARQGWGSEILDDLLAAGADPKALDLWGLSPLGIALVAGQKDIEAHLRAKGLRESVFDAVHGGRGEALAERLRLDPESARTPNGFGVSAAAVAAGLDRPELLEAFFAAGVAPDLTEPFAGRSLLHFAAIRNATNAMRRLLKAGARTEVFDARGLTPLHHAASAGAGDAVRLLVRSGAGLEARSRPAQPQFRGTTVDFPGGTPLHLAAISAETNSLKALLEAGASTTATDARGRTPRDLVVTPESHLFNLEMDALYLCRPLLRTEDLSRRDLEQQQRYARQWLSTGRSPRP